ncbi:MAG: hypothetical protein ABI851_08255 [Saprospiraceae bacterium]
MKKIICIILIISNLILIQCKNPVDQKNMEKAMPSIITLTPFSPSQEFQDATISSMYYKDSIFEFGITGNYTLGQQTPDAPQKMCANSDKGQHIHLIIDNKPYEAKYASSFNYPVDSGEHYILSFLSRSYHESIKTKTANRLVFATVENHSFKKIVPVNNPMVFYSRPKGVYIGNDTKKVMLDFYLANCELGSSYKIKAEVNDTSFLIDHWQPYYIEGLPMGENKIILSLIDSNGVLVNTPLNPVERKFTLQKEPNQQ